jgi:DNA (cytosine-5)-methyltransferase 1
MNVLSVCTGIGGIDLGLERAGWRIVAQCEKDAYRRRVLARHWPRVPCYEDIRLVGVRERPSDHGGEATRAEGSSGPAPTVDLLCGGTPCQDLSVAGRRAGLLDGERSSLFFEFARIADELVRPGGWLLFENVPGLLSSPGGAASGRDFAIILATLADVGFHDLAWRVLDSRYFGVPQRRRRVFIVARRAVGDRARAVLLEPESGGGDFAPSREAGTRVAASLTSGSHGADVNEPGRRKEDDINIVGAIVVSALDRKAGGADDNDAQANHLVAHNVVGASSDADRVRATPGPSGRLDDPDGGELDPQPDGPRYSACGDAVTVPVAQWIGERILAEVNRRAREAA